MSTETYTCPAAINIAGEHFPCQQMEHMAEGSKNHDGWAHSNRDAQAIWTEDADRLVQPASSEREGQR